MNLNENVQGFVKRMDADHEIAMAWKDGTLELRMKCLAKDFRREIC